MSRIHDALKRAEEQKTDDGLDDILSPSEMSAAKDTPAANVIVSLDGGSSAATVAARVAQVMAVSDAPVVRTPRNWSWDAIAEHCPKRRWTPEKTMLFLEDNSGKKPGMEEFRTLRSRLYHFREKKPLKSVLISSGLPGEGKTFVSANLAQTLARQHGRRVALIDGDLRRAHLHSCLGAERGPGLSEYLRGECNEFDILQRGPVENLVFIPGGSAVTHPAELVASSRLETLLKRLAEVFDWIIIDSPPVVPVSDATVLARVCDGVLLVVEAANTPFDVAQRARQEFKNVPVLGVVLNRVESETSYTSYYYGYGEKDQGVTK